MNRSIVWIASWELQKVLVGAEIFEGGSRAMDTLWEVDKRLWEEGYNRPFKFMRNWGESL